MKKLILVMLIQVPYLVHAESYLPNYGYYENTNEITAKDRIIPETTKIFDFDNAPNPGGESLQDGRYYVPVQYKGGYNGTDTDYLYVDELIGKDGINGVDGEDGKDGRDGSDADARVAEEKIIIETRERIDSENKINANLRATNNRVDALDNRVSNLEETKVLIDVEVRLFDTKRTAVSIYNSYDYRHQRNNAIGLKFLVKIGKSYEEKRIEEIEKKLERLERAANQSTISFAIRNITEEK